jgi:predicted transcriptional regulator YdeE
MAQEVSGEPRIVERPELLLVGMVSRGGDIGALWERFMPRESLIQHRVEGAWWELHVHPKDQPPGDPYWILVGVEVTKLETVPDDLFVKPIPAGQYAVFPHRPGLGEPNHGYDALNRRIEAWLEAGPYRIAREFSLQLYDARFKGMEDPESVEDLLIPIGPKG